jgi:hypothetical protein
MNREPGHSNRATLLLARLLFAVAGVWLVMGMGNVVVAAVRTKVVRSPRDAATVAAPKQSSMPPMPVATASAAKSTAAAIPVKPFVLTWDAEPGISNWTVYSGPARNQWTATNTIGTNVLAITDKTKAYGITAVFLGAPSVVAYWPSNRLGQLWLTGYSADLTQRTNVARLTGTFTNNPPGNMQLWGVENRTVGWE